MYGVPVEEITGFGPEELFELVWSGLPPLLDIWNGNDCIQ